MLEALGLRIHLQFRVEMIERAERIFIATGPNRIWKTTTPLSCLRQDQHDRFEAGVRGGTVVEYDWKESIQVPCNEGIG